MVAVVKQVRLTTASQASQRIGRYSTWTEREVPIGIGKHRQISSHPKGVNDLTLGFYLDPPQGNFSVGHSKAMGGV